jgi:hypothetical protein
VKRWKIDTGFDYEVRGEITTMRLDALIEHDVQVSRRERSRGLRVCIWKGRLPLPRGCSHGGNHVPLAGLED